MKPNLLARLQALEAEARSGKIPTTGDDGQPCWIESRPAIRIMFNMIRATRDAGKGRKLMISEYPENFQHLIRLWARSEPGEDSGQLCKMVKEMCLEAMAYET